MNLLLICSVKLWKTILYRNAGCLHTCCRNFQSFLYQAMFPLEKNFLTERVVKYWNRLPREMVESLEVFSKQGDVGLCDIAWGACDIQAKAGLYDIGDLFQP